MRSMTSEELHEAIRQAMAEVSRRLAAGELERSGRFYSGTEWRRKFAATSPERGRSARLKPIASRRPKTKPR